VFCRPAKRSVALHGGFAIAAAVAQHERDKEAALFVALQTGG
jgi:hypothetical protein